jgi:D-alanyl-D-alanine dipeptidase
MVNRSRPAAKTALAQIQAPRSAGGRTGQVHGAVQPASSAYWQNARYPIGSVQASRPPVASEHSSPMPVIPMTFLASTRTPSLRLSPAAPS